MTLYTDDRAHPIKGMVNNPEWVGTRKNRCALYLDSRKYRTNPDREPTGTGLAGLVLSIVGVIVAAASLIGGVL